MDDTELLARFRESTLTEFPHEHHVRIAYLVVRERGEGPGAEEFMQGLRNLAARFGALPSMLHVTRTRAWIRLIAHRIADPAQSSTQFVDAHPELRRKDLLDDYYSWRRLSSLRARRTFVEPDRMPLPGAPAAATGSGSESGDQVPGRFHCSLRGRQSATPGGSRVG